MSVVFPFSLLFLKLAISYFGTKQKTLYIKFGYLSCRFPNINTFLNTTLIFCEFFVSFLFLPHAPKIKKAQMGISITLSIKDRYLERPYNDDKGEYNTLTPFCVCIYTSRRPAFVHKQNRSAIFLCSLWVRNFPGFVLGQSKMR